MRLAVAGAFHTDFMAPAREQLQAALASTNIKVGWGVRGGWVEQGGWWAPRGRPGVIRRLPASRQLRCAAAPPPRSILPLPPCSRACPLLASVPLAHVPCNPCPAGPPQEPRLPVISNVDAAPHSDPEAIKAILAQQLTAPVQFEGSIKALLERGLERSYEIGPNKVRRADGCLRAAPACVLLRSSGVRVC